MKTKHSSLFSSGEMDTGEAPVWQMHGRAPTEASGEMKKRSFDDFIGPCVHGRDPYDRCDETDDPDFGGCQNLGAREAELLALRSRAEKAEARCKELEEALMAAQLHLMVRPHMRLEQAEKNLRALISHAINRGQP